MLDKFEKEKRRKMTEIWHKHFDEYKDGFELFTSELYKDAPALVIGFNPGGELHTDKMTRDRMQQFTDGDYSRPSQVVEAGKHYHPCETPGYASHSNQPGRIRTYLFDGKRDLLSQTVETNRFYMRTNGKGQHRKFLQRLSAEPFQDYMRFCRETAHETIKRTNPISLLTLPTNTMVRRRSSVPTLGSIRSLGVTIRMEVVNQ
jgi:hypothetical protein